MSYLTTTGLSSTLGFSAAIGFDPGGVPRKEQLGGVLNLMVLGASIMNDSFGYGRVALAEQLLEDAGIRARVFERAVGGTRSSTALASLPGNITEMGKLLGINKYGVHTGGNDVSDFGPYSGGAADLVTNVQAMVQLVTAEGDSFISTPISYRTPPASNPAEPYNVDLLAMLATDNPTWLKDGVSIWDMHTLTFDNQSEMVDGIHPSTTLQGLIRESLVSAVVSKYTQVIPDTVGIQDALLRFGPNQNRRDFMGLSRNVVHTNLLDTEIYNTDLSKVVGGAVQISAGGSSTGGFDSQTEIGLVIRNSAIDKESRFSSTGFTVSFNAASLEAGATYTVQVAGNRNGTTGARFTEITIGSTTQTYDSETVTDYVEFTGVTHTDLLAGIAAAPQVGSSNCYVSGIRVTKE